MVARVRDERIKSRAATITDQAFYSAVAFAQIIVYARLLDKTEFGIFSLVVAISLVLLGIQRSSIIVPAIVLFATPGDFRRAGRWARVQFLFTLAATLSLAVAGGVALVLDLMDIAPLLLLAAPLSAGTLLYDFQRKALYQLQREAIVLICSVVYLIANMAAIGAVAMMEEPGAEAAVLLATAASLMVAGVARWQRGPLAVEAGKAGGDGRSVVLWNGLSFLPYTLYNNGMVLIAGAIGGAGAAAVFAATRIFVSPIHVLIGAIDNTDKPRAARALAQGGHKGLFGSLRNTAATLLVLGVPYLAVIALFPGFIGQLILGAQYADDVWLGRIWALVGLLMLLGQPLETGLVTLRKSAWVFACRCLAALVSVTAAFLLFPYLGAAGVVAGLGIGWVLAGIFALGALRKHSAAGQQT